MKKTQKSLMLAVVFSLASGQALQAYWREKAKTGLTKVKAGAIQTAGQVTEAWRKMDPARKQQVLEISTNIARAYLRGSLDPATEERVNRYLSPEAKDALQGAIVAQAAGKPVDPADKKKLEDAAVKTAVGVVTGSTQTKSKEVGISDPTGLTKRTGAVTDLMSDENARQNIIKTLSSGSFKGDEGRQKQFLGTFGLTESQINSIMADVKKAEAN